MPLLNRRICIDPGHPSENGIGAANGSVTEVGIAWRVSVRLRERLLTGGAIVTLTKSAERQMVSNRRRAETANNWHADLALRLHCDDAPGISGIAIYYPSTEGKAPDGHCGPSAFVIAESRRLARPFHTGLTRALSGNLNDRGVLTDHETSIGGRQGALTGSIYSQVPVLLVEMCVLNNAADIAFLRRGGEDVLANALFAGIDEAFRQD